MQVLVLVLCINLVTISSTFVLRPQLRRYLGQEPSNGSIVSAIRLWLPWTFHSKPIAREPPQCTHFDLTLMTVCFERYFSYYGLSLAEGHLLPSVRTIYDHLSHNTHHNYTQNQERFDEFAACYLNAPESCYREYNFAKIANRPKEADYLVVFFTVSEYIYESQSNRNILACFREVLPELPRIQSHENVNERCRESLEILNMAISEFSTLCRPLYPAKGQLFAFIHRFVTRTTLGRACPKLLTSLNRNDT